MATGNIVIGKKGDGIDGILKNNKNGFLINPNSEELKKCIDKILSMKEDEISTIKANCAKTIKELTSQSAAENYLKNIQ